MADKIFGESPLNDVNNEVRVEPDGSINVNVLDQTTPSLDLFFIKALTVPVTLAVATEIDDYSVTVSDSTGMAVGNYFGISESVTERFYFGTILSIAGNVIGLDTPLDFAFPTTANAFAATNNLNVVGSPASPQIFDIRTVPTTGDLIIDIVRLSISIVCAGQPDDGLFGNLTKLTNGVILRRVNGDTRNLWNAKSNADLGILSGIDTVYSARSVPQGSYGVKSRITYAGQEKHGTIIRLLPGDYLQLIIRDDLSDLISFKVMAQGHIVEGVVI